MVKKDFTLSLYPELLQEITLSKKFTLPEKQDVFFFYFESPPNLKRGDSLVLRIIIDSDSYVEFDADVEDIVPPLRQPPSQECLDAHIFVLQNYMTKEVVSKIKAKYFEGKAQKDEWTVYLRKASQLP